MAENTECSDWPINWKKSEQKLAEEKTNRFVSERLVSGVLGRLGISVQKLVQKPVQAGHIYWSSAVLLTVQLEKLQLGKQTNLLFKLKSENDFD